MTNLTQKIREICTTHKDNGSGYYNLSEEQFQKLFALFKQEMQECVGSMEGEEAGYVARVIGNGVRQEILAEIEKRFGRDINVSSKEDGKVS